MDAFLGISAWFHWSKLIQVYPCIPSHAPLIPLITQPLGVNLHEPWAASCAPRGGCPVLDHSKDAKDPMRRWNAEEHRPCYTNVNSTNKRIKMKSEKKTGCCGWPDQKHPTTRYVHLNQGNGAVAHCVGGGCGGAQDKNIKLHWCLCGVSPCYGVTQNTSLLMTKVCFKTWKQTSIVCSIRFRSYMFQPMIRLQGHLAKCSFKRNPLATQSCTNLIIYSLTELPAHPVNTCSKSKSAKCLSWFVRDGFV